MPFLMLAKRTGVALLLVPAILAGCGGGDEGPNEKRFDGDSADVASVVDELQRYARLDDGAKICEELPTPQLESNIERSFDVACEERVNEQLGDADTTITVRRLRVDGPLASATVSENDGKLTGMAFVKRDEEWRISRIRG
jgi:hypothetical protein